MNDRIRKLAVEAGTYQDQDIDGTRFLSMPESSWAKFAELIVRECMQQVEEQYKPVLEDEAMMKDTHWDGYVQCGVDSVVAIRKHFFGVEE